MRRRDLLALVSDMSRIIGMLKAEAETTSGINMNGVSYISVRFDTMNELLNAWHGQSVPALMTLLEEGNLVVRTEIDTKPACICPTECDCQNPDGEGVRGISEFCPIHNDTPDPDPECPVHGYGDAC